jgi:cephalosporin hydroxylase
MFYTPEGFITYRGHRAMQNQLAFPLFRELFDRQSFATVIEIGTAFGGTCLFLADEGRKRGFRCVSYDVRALVASAELAATGAVRVRDCFDPAALVEIAGFINDGRTLILCDGGNKVKEFLTFAPMLKAGDMIMAHDYAPDVASFEARVRGQYWEWLEVTDAHLAPALPGLKTYEVVPFWKAAWFCGVKR